MFISSNKIHSICYSILAGINHAAAVFCYVSHSYLLTTYIHIADEIYSKQTNDLYISMSTQATELTVTQIHAYTHAYMHMYI